MLLFFATNHEHAGLLFALFAILVTAKIMAEVFERMNQPAVVGEILAGVIIGPSVLGIVQPSEIIDVFAEIGVIFLLFNVGLDVKPKSILSVGSKAVMVGVLGIFVPFVAGYWVAWLWGGSSIEAMFIGAALVATSVGITARVLGSLGLLNESTSRVILGAAVIDDILGLMILSVVSSVSQGSINYYAIIGTVITAVIFVIVVGAVGAKIFNWLAPAIRNLKISSPFFKFGLILCLGLSFVALYIEVAAIIGAFLAGMALSEATEDNPKMRQLSHGVMEFTVPFFLVYIGMQLDITLFADLEVITYALVITGVAIVSKMLGCGIGAINMGFKNAARVGIGMVPRGEVGIVVAQIGLGLAAINDREFAAVLFMAVATTLIAPPFIKLLAPKRRPPEDDIHISDVVTRIG
ncbi:MAG: cation:proton antiporter [Acidobacteria bacterium]|nr:MAG: cation:proton antiporter [Acidobacteriota bacterium]REJ99162.1 MAG: cation:proton antiporter [Acidobacteriota bacterium]REK16117.1 MAG: cation:proton antiporter [Acidobacteriota bacterium]REK43798.1 MAG: cation:proton antiporter [Acidobacteriota bacterium]